MSFFYVKRFFVFCLLFFLPHLLILILFSYISFSFWCHDYFLFFFEGLKKYFFIFLFGVFVVFVLGGVAVFRYLSSGRGFFDLIVVFFLQLFLAVFSCFWLFVHRPVFLSFEYDRFRVVRVLDISRYEGDGVFWEFLMRPPGFIALRDLKGDEFYQYTLAAIEGFSLSFRRELWVPYESRVSSILRNLKTVDNFNCIGYRPEDCFRQILISNNHQKEDVGWIPGVDGDKFFTVVVSAENGKVLGYLPIDPY